MLSADSIYMRRRIATSSVPSAPRRGRPPVISDERLLDTARNVFLEHGIRATTAEVALRARISEGTIFHRFKSKDALFRAAMRVQPETMAALAESFMPRVGEPDLRAAIVELANRVIELVRLVLPLAMMSWSNPSSDYSIEKMVNRQAALDGPRRALVAFLQGEMDAGRLLPSNVQVMSRLFVGGLKDYCMTELLQPDDPLRPPAAAFVDGLVDLLFPPPPAPRPVRRPKP